MRRSRTDSSSSLSSDFSRRTFDTVLISFLAMSLIITHLPTTRVFPSLVYMHCEDNEQSAIDASGISGWEVLNFDGDVSLSSHEDERYWNPHLVGFTEAVAWNILFSDEALISIETVVGEAGHVATGMWWTAGFESGAKIPVYTSTPSKICVDLDVKVDMAVYEGSDEWLRIALACALQRADGSVVYTEMDFWDSPNTRRHPAGNAQLGGDIIYQGEDVVEFKIDQVPMGAWKHYHVDLTSYIDRAWKIGPDDRLESVYIVVESINNPIKVIIRADNLWIRSHTTL